MSGFHLKTRKSCRSDATTFELKKQIFLCTLPKTGFNTDVCSYLSLSQVDCDPSRDCLTPEVDWLTMLGGARAMPDNGK